MKPRLLQSVLERIRPTPKELKAERRFAQGLVSMISRVSPKGCKAVLTGSVAKGTYLRDSKDIDIFVLFPQDYPRGEFEPAVERMVKKAFPGMGYKLSYAEHPYARFHFDGRRVDLVPAYMIKNASERLSAVDRSVLHTRYVLGNMKPRQKDEVLLLKQFLKANGIYGAEIKVGGFSGYLCELLVLEYKSFMQLLSAASGWKMPVLVDLEAAYTKAGKKGREELFARFLSRFVVIDPTDKNRNVAAALSEENAMRFIGLAKAFRKRPLLNAFFREPEGFEQKVAWLSKKGHAYVITLLKPDVVDDVLWGQVRKMMKQLSVRLMEDGFEFPVSGNGLVADDSGGLVRLAFAVKKDELPKKILVQGPPLGMLSHVLAFMKHHRVAKFARKKGRIYAVIRRKIRTPGESLAAFFSSLRERGKSHLGYPIALAKVEKKAKMSS